jgi:hypothetical protein
MNNNLSISTAQQAAALPPDFIPHVYSAPHGPQTIEAQEGQHG